ncbi:glyoxylate reductase/hydroxypyruvate reductase [Halyomorpha halys]|uniref:glyoxylate reductase/hydroxypyruvate reductase n=1 Tax=Halyomorpha halys TaxID=286706 RepID=UPI0006D4E9CB|nr:glyoxylate reductase/hydroxypyruvate reductase-like [Halyomorpha halys]
MAILCLKMAKRPKVFVSRSDYPEAGIKLLRDRCEVEMHSGIEDPAPEELLPKLVGTDALFVDTQTKITKEVIETAAKNGLKIISTMSVGLDHIDLEAVKKTSIKIGHTPNVLTEATAELTVALLLATSRRVVEGHNTIVRGEWNLWTPTFLCGRGLYKSVVGIVGFGRIGQSVAKKLISFETSKILYSGPRRKLEGDQLGAQFVDFDKLLQQSDFVIVTCPLTPETRGIFTAEKFLLMKRSAIFINSARGGIVDQEALIHALKNKIIAAAGLDVMTPEPLPEDHPLVKLDNCVLTPHIGSNTEETLNGMAILAAKNILATLDGEKMPAEYIL